MYRARLAHQWPSETMRMSAQSCRHAAIDVHLPLPERHRGTEKTAATLIVGPRHDDLRFDGCREATTRCLCDSVVCISSTRARCSHANIASSNVTRRLRTSPSAVQFRSAHDRVVYRVMLA